MGALETPGAATLPQVSTQGAILTSVLASLAASIFETPGVATAGAVETPGAAKTFGSFGAAILSLQLARISPVTSSLQVLLDSPG